MKYDVPMHAVHILPVQYKKGVIEAYKLFIGN